MKAEFSIKFGDEKKARRALKILSSANAKARDEEETGRAALKLEAEKEELHATVTAADFAALRARCTSFLRDVKIVLDAQNALQTKNS
ncbi:MAG: KEOPS complex subunit Pcc1 [Candidatus Micrarchaeia archaeon]